ncbi:MAG: VWA domain-containing protein [Vicinamibacterales bacterium]
MARTRTLTAALIIVALPTLLAAQSPRTFRSRTELVTVGVAVQDDADHYVLGLTADQFEVIEDGVRQDIRFFGAGELPLDLLLMLDVSGSMRSSLPLVQKAAAGFARTMRPEDRMSVMSISDGLQVLQPLTGETALVERAIQHLRAQGKTPLYAALYVALGQLRQERARYAQPRRQAIVVLSDGRDTASSVGFDDLMDAARRGGVPIYAIAPRPPADVRARRERLGLDTLQSLDFDLRALARDTGGRAFFPTAAADLEGVYADIANELAHQYSVGYESSNAARDGRFRQVEIRVAVSGVRWRNRPGYQAAGTAAMTDFSR